MMLHGLSGTTTSGRSGTRSSDHREPNCAKKAQRPELHGALNLANTESFGFLLTPTRLANDKGQPFLAPSCELPGDSSQLTQVTLVWQKGWREDWLKFGKPVASLIVDRRQRKEFYSAGQVFGLVCWAANDFGTVRSSLHIVRAVCAGEAVIPVPQVDPGGDLLLSAFGWPKVARVFRLIDAIEASGIDPCDVAPDHWRHIHNRLAARETPRSYSPARHRAWLQRKALTR